MSLLQDEFWVEVSIVLVRCFDVCMTHYAAKCLRGDARFYCAGRECMPAAIRGHICDAQLVHELCKIPFLEIGGISVAGIAVDQALATGFSGGAQKRMVGFQSV